MALRRMSSPCSRPTSSRACRAASAARTRSWCTCASRSSSRRSRSRRATRRTSGSRTSRFPRPATPCCCPPARGWRRGARPRRSSRTRPGALARRRVRCRSTASSSMATSRRSGRARIAWRCARRAARRWLATPIVLPLRIVPDSAPALEIPVPGADTTASPDARALIVVDAHDDHGLKSVVLELRRVSGLGTADPVREQAVALPGGTPDRAVLSTQVNLQQLGLVPGDTLHYRARAVDNSPRAQSGWSQRVRAPHPDAHRAPGGAAPRNVVAAEPPRLPERREQEAGAADGGPRALAAARRHQAGRQLRQPQLRAGEEGRGGRRVAAGTDEAGGAGAAGAAGTAEERRDRRHRRFRAHGAAGRGAAAAGQGADARDPRQARRAAPGTQGTRRRAHPGSPQGPGREAEGTAGGAGAEPRAVRARRHGRTAGEPGAGLEGTAEGPGRLEQAGRDRRQPARRRGGAAAREEGGVTVVRAQAALRADEGHPARRQARPGVAAGGQGCAEDAAGVEVGEVGPEAEGEVARARRRRRSSPRWATTCRKSGSRWRRTGATRCCRNSTRRWPT